MNYYEILQVSPDASEEVICAAYRSLVKKYHPDSGLEQGSEKFIQIEEAYKVLSNAEKRKEYDEMLKTQDMSMQELDEKDTEDAPDTDIDNKKDGSSIFAKIFSYLFWIFVIACFVTNMEQYRMKIYNAIGKYEFNEEAGDCKVTINVEYKKKLLRRTPKVWLNVDGKRVQVLKEGDDYDYDCKVSPGKHIVFVETKTLHANSNIYTFTVLPDSEETTVYCTINGMDNWWGVDFTMDDTWR